MSIVNPIRPGLQLSFIQTKMDLVLDVLVVFCKILYRVYDGVNYQPSDDTGLV